MTMAIQKWQVVENVVAAIKKATSEIPGVQVIPRAQLPRIADQGMTRDIDVLVRVPSPDGFVDTCIEVKNKARPLTLDQMGCIADLCRDVRHNRFCVVSTSSFSAGARIKAKENGIELTELVEFDTSTFWACTPIEMMVHTSGVFLKTAMQFPEAVLAEIGAKISQALTLSNMENMFLDYGGNVTSVANLMNAAFQRHLSTLEHEKPEDGSIYTLAIDCEGLIGATMRINETVFPPPTRITTAARIAESRIAVSESRFRLGDVEAVTMELDLLGARRQLSMVAVPQEDGATQLKLVVGPAKPTKVWFATGGKGAGEPSIPRDPPENSDDGGDVRPPE